MRLKSATILVGLLLPAAIVLSGKGAIGKAA